MGHIESKIKNLKGLLRVFTHIFTGSFAILRYEDIHYTQPIYLAIAGSTYYIVLYKNCLCNVHVTEDVDHFFWTCPRYESHRQTMIFDLSTIIPNQMPISITKSGRKHITSVIINGDTSISVNENLSIFHIVERYVNNTKRFM